MGIIENLFYIVPLTSALCNLFLLLTFLSAKKDKLTRSFMCLLIVFTTWPLGSFFMRIGLYPGEPFWFQISMISILLVPLLIYSFLYHYTEQKGAFTMVIFHIATFIIVFLNMLNVFITDPHIEISSNGQKGFVFGVSPMAAIPIVLAIAILYCAGRIIYNSIQYDGLPFSMFKPFMIGIIVMFVSLMLEIIPGLSAIFPLDPFSCMVNAILLYYMLYKKRVFTLTQFASSGSTYLVSTVITSLILASCFPIFNAFYKTYFPALLAYESIVTAIIFSIVTILTFNLLKGLTNNLFVKSQNIKEATLKDFSIAISKTLNRNEILNIFTDLIREHSDVETAYIFSLDNDRTSYKMMTCTNKMRSTSVAISKESPVTEWLLSHKEGIAYNDFRYTVNFKSMWESEKDIFESLRAEFILPILCDEELIGILILEARQNKKTYAFSEISFLESVTSIVSIALKNASLYEQIQEEAHMDALTNLYNRRYFTQELEKQFEQFKNSSLTLILFSFDDFKLYNELYGSNDGDEMLKSFANILKIIISTRGTIGRYSGKEFSVCLPLCSTDEAEMIVNDIREELNNVLSNSEETTKRFLTFSAGISSYPASASNMNQLLTYANMAVYAGKKSGKNKTIVYSDHKQEVETKALSFANIEAIGHEYSPTIYALTAAIDAKDHYTFSHSVNVSYLATQLARFIGLDDEHVEMIRQAGLLHDIGKISIPEDILTKTTALTDDEYEVMKSHVENSIAMIRHLPSLDYVIPIAISHHEHYDGTGYPRGLKGEEIPIGGRCLAIADAFDAIVSKRPYKEPVTIPEALEEIERNLGKQFDPEIGRTFIELVKSNTIYTDIYK